MTSRLTTFGARRASSSSSSNSLRVSVTGVPSTVTSRVPTPIRIGPRTSGSSGWLRARAARVRRRTASIRASNSGMPNGFTM
jgi:hypothetical protein